MKRGRHGNGHSHASWPESTLVGGRKLGYIRAEMLWYFAMRKPSDAAFEEYADRMRTWYRTLWPTNPNWRLIPRIKNDLFEQTGYYKFKAQLWEYINGPKRCPESG